MPGLGERVFRRGVHLAVLGDTEDDDGGGQQFWLCSTTAEVFSQHDSFTVVWLERLEKVEILQISLANFYLVITAVPFPE